MACCPDCELDQMREERKMFQTIADHSTRQLGAIAEALGISGEAEPDVWLARIADLRAVERNALRLAQDTDRPASAFAANWILTGGG